MGDEFSLSHQTVQASTLLKALGEQRESDTNRQNKIEKKGISKTLLLESFFLFKASKWVLWDYMVVGCGMNQRPLQFEG